MPNYKLNIAMATHRGVRRSHNEDAVSYYYPSDYDTLCERGVLVVLADGVGSLPDGEKASQYAVQRLLELYYDAPIAMVADDALLTSIEQINMEVHRNFEQDLATTIVAVVIRQGQVITAHVGDSRLYWFDGKVVLQYTQDHSMLAVDDKNRKKKKLTQAIGHRNSVQVEITKEGISTGQGLLLLSDGATAYLNEDDLLTLMKENPREIVADVIHYSLQGGGHDNISAIMVAVDDVLLDADALKRHLQILNSEGVAVYVVNKSPISQDNSRVNRLRWRLFLVIIILLVMIISSLVVYMDETNQQKYASITQLPADATMRVDDNANVSLPNNIIIAGGYVKFTDSARTVSEVASHTAAFMIVPNSLYQVISTFVDENNQVWYQVYDKDTDRSGWIIETDLPDYTVSD